MSTQLTTSYTPQQITETVNFLIENNRHLQKNNKVPKTIRIKGEAGIGKTSIIEQIAKNNNLDFVKFNLAEIDELGNIIGFPIRQFEFKKAVLIDENTTVGVFDNYKYEWVDEHLINNFLSLGFEFTGNKRMSYCVPEWIANKKSGGILLLDDFSRSSIRMMQGLMELINTQKYFSWKLPEDWHIIITDNPTDGDYTTTEMDIAHLTRFMTFNMIFDVKDWAKYAESSMIDPRGINFLLLHPDLISNKNKNVNPRSVTMFFDSIVSIDDYFEKLPLIADIGEACVGMEFTQLFITFINNKLDKLISPQDILTDNWISVQVRLKEIIGINENYRADIASVIATRLINYSLLFSKTNPVPDTMITRLKELVKSNIFTVDLVFSIVRTIFNEERVKFKKLTLDVDLAKILV